MTDMVIVFILTTHLQYLRGVLFLFGDCFLVPILIFIIAFYIVYGIGVFLIVIICRLCSIIP